MIQRLKAIILKECRHILRDNQTLAIILLMPVIMMFLYGYALTMDINDAPVLVVNPSNSSIVNLIAQRIDASPMFEVVEIISNAMNPAEEFRARHVQVICRFSPDFSANIHNGGKSAPIQVLIDGTDPNTATILKNAIESMLVSVIIDMLNIQKPQVITISPRILFNQEQKSALYFVPGLMAVILLMISALLTSLTLTREKELGTMEQLLVSPLHPLEIILGKIIPYIFLAGIDGILVVLTGRFAFGIHIAGSPWFLAFASTLYIFTSLSIGMLISTVAANQQQAMMIVLPVTMLPTIILSGFIFPLASLPLFLRLISNIIPATWFLQIIRGIFLKGIGISILWPQVVIVSVIGFFLVTLSIKRFREQL